MNQIISVCLWIWSSHHGVAGYGQLWGNSAAPKPQRNPSVFFYFQMRWMPWYFWVCVSLSNGSWYSRHSMEINILWHLLGTAFLRMWGRKEERQGRGMLNSKQEQILGPGWKAKDPSRSEESAAFKVIFAYMANFSPLPFRKHPLQKPLKEVKLNCTLIRSVFKNSAQVWLFRTNQYFQLQEVLLSSSFKSL